MKILGQLSLPAAPLAVAFSMLLVTGNLRAAGGGGAGGTASGAGGTAGGTGGVGAAGMSGGGVSAGGGSHGGSGAVGVGHGSFSAPATVGARPGVSFSNNGFRTSGGLSSQSSLTRAGGLPGYSSGGRMLSPTVNQLRNGTQSTARATNAWSGTAVNPANNATGRTSANQLYTSNGYTNNRFAGRVNSNGYNNYLGGNGYHNGNLNGRIRFPDRYYNYPYAYGPYYAPYLGYYGGYAGAYPYYADGTYSDIANGSDGYGNGASTVAPQYTDQGQDANGNNQQPQAPAPQAAPQNPNGSNAAQGTIPNNGPDSLVEAVQQELIRRGYFGGKVDAMYGPDTKEALRKFQQDHHLADSGLINEATLHALQLD